MPRYRYPPVKDGEWIPLRRRGFRMMCCDCALVHELEFKLVPHAGGKRIMFRATRHKRATATARAAILKATRRVASRKRSR